ncbi:DUF6291 domain-containing protein [Seonamhaeicola sp.]|uniref:DUF6291 domain-containing protein n=1 Tax=Seonamhaeicola sp. TaxID=1912245 RepID=UPI0035634B54
MAKDKKSFILYSDQRSVIDMLTDEQAGKLIKHIYSYVNDENPTLEDQLLKLAFEPIKLQLKRDLIKYEDKKIDRSNAGKLGNLKKYHKDLFDRVQSEDLTLNAALNIAKSRKATQSDAKLADNDNVNDTDNDNDNVNDNVNVIDINNCLTIILNDKDWINRLIEKDKIKSQKDFTDWFDNVYLDAGHEVGNPKDIKTHFNNAINSGKVNIKKPIQSVFSGGNTKMGITL